MSAASEALADVRGWLCDNLSSGDAGKVCGMLSVVSRHITELEDENARLRSCLSDDAENARQIMSENSKLREYAELYAKAVEGEGCGWCLYDTCAMCDVETIPIRDGCKLYDELLELGIEVRHV